MSRLKYLLLLLLFAMPLHAQQTATQTVTFTTATSGPSLGLANSGTQYNSFQWWGFGTLATCTIKLEQSATGVGSWSDLIAGVACTSNGVATVTAGKPNFVRLTVTALSGGGNIIVRYTGGATAATGSSVSISNVPHVICDSGCAAGTPGQALMAASSPVVIASDQSAVPVTVSNAAQETGGNLDAIKADTDKIPALGQALAAASVPAVLPSAQITTLTPPSASAIGSAVAAPSASAIASAIVSNPPTVPVTGTFYPATQPVSMASAQVASGAYASGSVSDAAIVTLGAKADAKSTATDTTAVTAMQVLKEISALEQAPASRAVTNIGTFPTQSAITAASGSIASGAVASGAFASGALASGSVASGAIASGAIASGACVSGCVADGGISTLGAKADAKSSATDTTAITQMQVLKEISYLLQSDPCGPAHAKTTVLYDTNTSGKTQLVGLSGSTVIYACGIAISQSTSTTVTVSLGSGTGTNCGSTYTAKTPAWVIQGPASVAPIGLVENNGPNPWAQTAAGEELCISTSAGVSVQAQVVYTQF